MDVSFSVSLVFGSLGLPELVAVDPFFSVNIYIYLLFTNVWCPVILRAFVEPF